MPKKCVVCDAAYVDLHHRSYARVGGTERLHDLVPLCRAHHELVHAKHREFSGDPSKLWEWTRRTIKHERRLIRKKAQLEHARRMKARHAARLQRQQGS